MSALRERRNRRQTRQPNEIKMSFIKINRNKTYADAARAYAVLLDGEKIGEIRSGATAEFPVTAGAHRISLKIDWCGSPEIEFDVRENEIVEFDCGNNTKTFLAFFYILFAPKEYLWLEKK